MEVSSTSCGPEATPQTLFGRQQELERLTDWILTGPAVVQVYGQPGSGKTSLLRALTRRLELRGIPVAWLNAALTRANAEVVQAFFRELPDSSEGDPAVLVVDDFDMHAPLHPVYWQRLLPSLCPNTRVVLASSVAITGAHSPSREHTLSVVALRPFDDATSRGFLGALGVPDNRREELIAWTGGLPLLLATLADFAGDQEENALRPPDDRQRALGATLVKVLSETPSDEHRQALWASALPMVLSERLLASMLDHPRSNECFRWLRTRPYIEQTAEGLVVHRSFREPLLDSLMQQAPLLHRDYLIRAGHFHIARTTGHNTRDRVGAATAHFFTQRRMYPLSRHSQALARSELFEDAYAERDAAAIDQIVAQQVGRASVPLARLWRERQPEQLRVFRNNDGDARAFVQAVVVTGGGKEDAAGDPAVAAAQRVLAERDQERRKTRPHGRQRARKQQALLFRFFGAHTANENGDPSSAEIMEHMLMRVISLPKASLSLLTTRAQDASSADALLRAGLARTFTNGRFVVDGQQFSLIGHDFMDASLAQWLRQALVILVSGARNPERGDSGQTILDRSAFDHAVRDALEGYFDERTLAENPLAHELATYTELPADRRIKHWLRDGLSQLARMPGGETYAQRLQHRYFEHDGAATMETPSDHLMAAIQLLVATLWDAHVARPSPDYS